MGDPQIGASWRAMSKNLSEEEIQDRAVRNDSFNWNSTLESIINRNYNISFIISAGDQIQSRDKGKSNISYNKNEIEYAGYLSPAVLKRADAQISFGRFTLPHQLMRLVLSEQIYRAFTIINGLPYHK